MSDDGDAVKFQMKKSVGAMDGGKEIFAQADNMEDCKNMFDHLDESVSE